jgi:hypothetical protein
MLRFNHQRTVVLRCMLGATLCSAMSCTDSTAPVAVWLRIEPTRARYAPGDSVTVIVSNIGSAPVGTNACGSSIDRLDNGNWTNVGSFSDDCGDVAFVIDVGESRPLVAGALPESLAPGTYRLRIPEARTAQGPLEVLAGSQLTSAPMLVEP